ncbi:hypothetical protein GCM10023340_06670 [Nocardioides marinquilinus]|uniref:2-C-methyl-D-erythritol 4-phosphate cytidylyltransferase n=1 Tax=Nocardioides marinquilinus TaxID=1210400 RepID=A0ABP9P9Z5_9ACTN
MDDERPTALGLVVDADRGSLPYRLVHGEALVAAAAWALGEAGVDLVDATVPWEALREAGEPVVLHDSLCPLTPPDFIARCVDLALELDAVVVGVRPVTDTVKVVEDGLVGRTLDRQSLLAVCSPLVLPARVVAGLERVPTWDFTELVARLREQDAVETLTAPSTAARVAEEADVRLLESLR